jgi:hypothetical protein
MRYLRRAQLTQEEKNYVVYDLLESTLLNFRARAKLSKDEIRRQSDAATERLDELKSDLGEEYVASMKERIKSIWVPRIQMATKNDRMSQHKKTLK